MGMNVLTTAMAFSVSAFFVLFVFTRILCARIHLRNAAAQHAAAAQAGDVAIHVSHPISLIQLLASLRSRPILSEELFDWFAG
jgi:hypothetical protein